MHDGRELADAEQAKSFDHDVNDGCPPPEGHVDEVYFRFTATFPLSRREGGSYLETFKEQWPRIKAMLILDVHKQIDDMDKGRTRPCPRDEDQPLDSLD